MLAGMGWVPEQALPRIHYQSEASLRRADEKFRAIKEQSAQLAATLPTNYEFLRQLHSQ